MGWLEAALVLAMGALVLAGLTAQAAFRQHSIVRRRRRLGREATVLGRWADELDAEAGVSLAISALLSELEDVDAVDLSVAVVEADGYRALTTEDDSGFIRVVALARDHVVLGIQATGGGISELAALFALTLEMGARLEDIAGTIHAHPTRSEGFQQAALKTLRHATHS